MFVHITDFSFDDACLVAFGKATIQASREVDDMYSVNIWLHKHPEVVVITYNDKKDRDADLKIIQDAVDPIRS